METEQILHIPLAQIYVDQQFNCRGVLTAMDFEDLAADIKANGQMMPGVVAPIDRPDMPNKKFMLVVGFRRFFACKTAEVPFYKAMVDTRAGQDRQFARLMNLRENLKRKSLNILQEALAIRPLVNGGMGRNTIAQELGVTPGWVQIRTMVLEFPTDIQAEFATGLITQPQIRELYTILKYGAPDELYAAFRKIKEGRLQGKSFIKLDKPKGKQDLKRVRPKQEIMEKLVNLTPIVGAGYHTRLAAWCAGEVSDGEISADDRAQRELTVLMKNNKDFHSVMDVEGVFLRYILGEMPAAELRRRLIEDFDWEVPE